MSDIAKKLILLLMAVVFTLGAAEILLRATGYGTITPEMNFGVNTRMALDRGSFLPDQDLFWKLPPNPQDAVLRAVQPDAQMPPKSSRPRILVIGDSCSRISMKIPPYSVLLEDSLQRYGLEVWNAAVPGYTVWQGRAWLDRQLLQMQPDVAVIYFGWNDHWRSTGITDSDYADRLSGGQLRLLMLFQGKPDTPPLRVPVSDYQAILTSMVIDLQAAGSRVVLVAGPSNLTRDAHQHLLQTHYVVPGDQPEALHGKYLEALHQVGRETGADVLDAHRIFKALGSPKLLLLRDGVHLTDLGHQVLASTMTALLDGHFSDLESGSQPPNTAQLTARARAVMVAKEGK